MSLLGTLEHQKWHGVAWITLLIIPIVDYHCFFIFYGFSPQISPKLHLLSPLDIKNGVWDIAKHYLGLYYQFCHFFIDFITRLAHSDINGRQTLIFSKKRKIWFFLANIHKITWKEPVTREFYFFSLYSPLLTIMSNVPFST